jgi:gas vesicle protein
MEIHIDKIIAPLIGGIFGFLTYLVTRKLDKWNHKKNYSKLGVVIMDSLLEEVNTGLDIIKKNQNTTLPKKSWDGMKTISDEVMLIILAISEGVKPDAFQLDQIRSHCKNYFENITQGWMNIQNSQDSTEKVKKMLEQTKSLLNKNSKKCCPK